jgi:hypothetical protein
MYISTGRNCWECFPYNFAFLTKPLFLTYSILTYQTSGRFHSRKECSYGGGVIRILPLTFVGDCPFCNVYKYTALLDKYNHTSMKPGYWLCCETISAVSPNCWNNFWGFIDTASKVVTIRKKLPWCHYHC